MITKEYRDFKNKKNDMFDIYVMIKLIFYIGIF